MKSLVDNVLARVMGGVEGSVAYCDIVHKNNDKEEAVLSVVNNIEGCVAWSIIIEMLAKKCICMASIHHRTITCPIIF